LILWELGKADAAAEAFTTSCNLAETLTGANLNKGIALFHAGRLDESELVLNNILGENPKDQTARALLGLIAAQRKQWVGTPKELAVAMGINPRNPENGNLSRSKIGAAVNMKK